VLLYLNHCQENLSVKILELFFPCILFELFIITPAKCTIYTHIQLFNAPTGFGTPVLSSGRLQVATHKKYLNLAATQQITNVLQVPCSTVQLKSVIIFIIHSSYIL
jgi:hypothetical protein